MDVGDGAKEQGTGPRTEGGRGLAPKVRNKRGGCRIILTDIHKRVRKPKSG